MPMPPAKQPPPFWVAVNFYATRVLLGCVLLSAVAWVAHVEWLKSALGAVYLLLVVIMLVGRWRGAPLSPPTSGRK